MKRSTAVLALLVATLLTGAVSPRLHADAAQATKTKCTAKLVVKKIHGKKKQVAVKVCRTVKRESRKTATATALPPPATPVPTVTLAHLRPATPAPTAGKALPTVSVSLASLPQGLSASQTGDSFTFTDDAVGGHITLSSLHMAIDNTSHLVLDAYETVTKSPSPNDDQLPYFDARSVSVGLALVASNHHPYFFDGTFTGFCDKKPWFDDEEVYNGDVDSGWICSEWLPSAVDGQYTVELSDSAGEIIDDFIIGPILDVTISG